MTRMFQQELIPCGEFMKIEKEQDLEVLSSLQELTLKTRTIKIKTTKSTTASTWDGKHLLMVLVVLLCWTIPSLVLTNLLLITPLCTTMWTTNQCTLLITLKDRNTTAPRLKMSLAWQPLFLSTIMTKPLLSMTSKESLFIPTLQLLRTPPSTMDLMKTKFGLSVCLTTTKLQSQTTTCADFTDNPEWTTLPSGVRSLVPPPGTKKTKCLNSSNSGTLESVLKALKWDICSNNTHLKTKMTQRDSDLTNLKSKALLAKHRLTRRQEEWMMFTLLTISPNNNATTLQMQRKTRTSSNTLKAWLNSMLSPPLLPQLL